MMRASGTRPSPKPTTSTRTSGSTSCSTCRCSPAISRRGWRRSTIVATASARSTEARAVRRRPDRRAPSRRQLSRGSGLSPDHAGGIANPICGTGALQQLPRAVRDSAMTPARGSQRPRLERRRELLPQRPRVARRDLVLDGDVRPPGRLVLRDEQAVKCVGEARRGSPRARRCPRGRAVPCPRSISPATVAGGGGAAVTAARRVASSASTPGGN